VQEQRAAVIQRKVQEQIKCGRGRSGAVEGNGVEAVEYLALATNHLLEPSTTDGALWVKNPSGATAMLAVCDSMFTGFGAASLLEMNALPVCCVNGAAFSDLMTSCHQASMMLSYRSQACHGMSSAL